MKVKFEIEFGDTTCAVEPGKFCCFVRSKHFGIEGYCLLFDRKLFDENGCLYRCKSCLEKWPAVLVRLVQRRVSESDVDNLVAIKKQIEESQKMRADIETKYFPKLDLRKPEVAENWIPTRETAKEEK